MIRKKSIKCPVCGNQEFISVEEPIYIANGDGSIRTNGEFYACTSCGLTLLFNTSAASRSTEKLNKRDDIDRQIQQLRNEISELEKEKEQLPSKIGALEKEKMDPNRTVARDQQLGEEIKALKSRLSGIDFQIAKRRDEIKRLEDSKRFLE